MPLYLCSIEGKVGGQEGGREGGREGGLQAKHTRQETYLVSGEDVLSVPLGGVGDQLRVGKGTNHLADGPVFLREGADARVGCRGMEGGRVEGVSGTEDIAQEYTLLT
jgi:hypothetical protein